MHGHEQKAFLSATGAAVNWSHWEAAPASLGKSGQLCTVREIARGERGSMAMCGTYSDNTVTGSKRHEKMSSLCVADVLSPVPLLGLCPARVLVA